MGIIIAVPTDRPFSLGKIFSVVILILNNSFNIMLFYITFIHTKTKQHKSYLGCPETHNCKKRRQPLILIDLAPSQAA